MTLAYSCLLIAILLPYVWAGVAKRRLIKDKAYDNNNPRLQMSALEGVELRANWAQQNSFEALPGFIAAVLVAHLAGVSQGVIDTLAVVHVVSRVAYGICYIKDLATPRSLVWTLGLFATIGLFVAAFL
jgi:uncharacterized MAPEG superfamily protein